MTKKLYGVEYEDGSLLRFGINGGGEPSYCVYLGQIVMFEKKNEAKKLIRGFSDPSKHKIVTFIRKEDK